jgi:hypothetical protein
VVADLNQRILAKMSEERELLEERHHLLLLASLHFLQQADIVLFLYGEKMGVLRRKYGCCSWLVVDQCEFSKLASVSYPKHFSVPVCVAENFSKLLDLLLLRDYLFAIYTKGLLLLIVQLEEGL